MSSDVATLPHELGSMGSTPGLAARWLVWAARRVLRRSAFHQADGLTRATQTTQYGPMARGKS